MLDRNSIRVDPVELVGVVDTETVPLARETLSDVARRPIEKQPVAYVCLVQAAANPSVRAKAKLVTDVLGDAPGVIDVRKRLHVFTARSRKDSLVRPCRGRSLTEARPVGADFFHDPDDVVK